MIGLVHQFIVLIFALQIDRISAEQISAAFEGVGGEIGWQLFAEEGDMRMYRRYMYLHEFFLYFILSKSLLREIKTNLTKRK